MSRDTCQLCRETRHCQPDLEMAAAVGICAESHSETRAVVGDDPVDHLEETFIGIRGDGVAAKCAV